MNIIKKTVADIMGDIETERIWDTARERLREILSRYKNIPPKEQIQNLIKWYKTLYQPQENPLYHVSKKDMDWIMAKIPPKWFVLLNPFVFLFVGAGLRKIKPEWFYDLLGIILPSLGMGMYGLIAIVNTL